MITNRDEETRKNIKKIMEIYPDGIQIFGLSKTKGRIRLETVQTEEDIRKISMKRLRYLEKQGIGIHFAPLNPYNAIFLDDVPTQNLMDLPKGTMVIKTSHNRYQAHIPMSCFPEPIKIPKNPPQNALQREIYQKTVEKIPLFQKHLQRYYESDPGANSLSHLRRLPCFRNEKYPNQQEPVQIANIEPKGNFAEIYENIRKITQEQKKIVAVAVEKIQKIQRQKTKSWSDFYDGLDESRADIRYALYLYGCGFSSQEIQDFLLAESPKLLERKKGHLLDYLRRTISRAEEYYLPSPNTKTKTDGPKT